MSTLPMVSNPHWRCNDLISLLLLNIITYCICRDTYLRTVVCLNKYQWLKTYWKRKAQMVLSSLNKSLDYILYMYQNFVLHLFELHRYAALGNMSECALRLDLSRKIEIIFFKNCILKRTWEKVLLQTLCQEIYLNGSKI